MAEAEAKSGEQNRGSSAFLGERAFIRLLLRAGVRARARKSLGARLLAQVIVYGHDCLRT